MVSDGLAKFRNALVRQGQQQLFAVVQHHFPLELGPDGEGKLLRTVGGEIQSGGMGGFLPDDGGNGLVHGPLHGLHKVAHLFLGTDVTFGEELAVGSLHGDLADLQVFRQSPLGGQLLPGFQSAGEDISPDAPVKSLVKGHTGGFLQFVG